MTVRNTKLVCRKPKKLGNITLRKSKRKDMLDALKTLQIDEDDQEIRPQFLYNHTHYSPPDRNVEPPGAKISTKPRKLRQMNYAGQLAVDNAHHVITGACASTAGSKYSANF